MPDAPSDRLPQEPQRPSRQELVVPPRHSSLGMVLGAVVSAVAGFGLVLGLGIGRGPDRASPEMPLVATSVSASLEPGQSPPVIEADAPADTDARGAIEPADAAAVGDRYAARPVSFDDPGDQPAAEPAPASDRPLSRFSSPDIPAAAPAGDEPAASDEVQDSAPAAGSASRPDPGPRGIDPGPGNDPLAPAVQPPSADGMPAEPTNRAPPPIADQTVDGVTEAAELPAAEPLDPPAAVAAGDASTISAADRPTVAAGAPPIDTAPAPAAAEAIESSPPVTAPLAVPLSPTESAAVGAAESPATIPEAGRLPPPPPPPVVPVAAVPAEQPPVFVTARSGGEPPPSPFAAAPPLGADPDPIPRLDSPRTPETDVAKQQPPGQGVPGPLQLEGVQTPHLAVEKRGPREIQVGRPARYEILVRNLGTAVAREVTLRDEVPRGASLIATTPPAAPASTGPDAGGGLVWDLGELPPGGESRVLMEIMPEAEGEIGSVASVSFRAEATLRSLSTRPRLEIDCPVPEPVRIGRDVPLTIRVANPGSGTATGIVLEGFLPGNVSHRAGNELEFDVGRLDPGESRTIDLVLGTRGPGVLPLRLMARADAGVEAASEVPVEVTAPAIELALDMPARRFLQRPATCSISMVNSGTASARAVELAVQLPAGIKFVRANNAGWHDERTHRVLWNLEELPAGETGTVEVIVMPVEAGPQRIMAAARSSDGPSDQAVTVCQVEGLAALAFHVADSEDPIEVGGVTEYVVRVANEGTKAATGVRLAASLAGDLDPVEVTGPGGHRLVAGGVAFEPLAKLGPGEEAVFRVSVRGRAAGHQRVQVQLVSEENPMPITREEVTSVYDDR